jgi:hypothetical protein
MQGSEPAGSDTAGKVRVSIGEAPQRMGLVMQQGNKALTSVKPD